MIYVLSDDLSAIAESVVNLYKKLTHPCVSMFRNRDVLISLFRGEVRQFWVPKQVPVGPWEFLLHLRRGNAEFCCVQWDFNHCVWMTWLIDRIWTGSGVTTYSLAPGFVDSELRRDIENACIMKLLVCCYRCFRSRLLTSEEGARTTLYCCLEPSLQHQSGLYYWYVQTVRDPRGGRLGRRATLALWSGKGNASVRY